MSIRPRLVGLLLAVGLGPLVVFALQVDARAAQVLEESAGDRLEAVATLQRARLDSLLASYLERLRLIASRTQLRRLLAQDRAALVPSRRLAVEAILRDALESLPDLQAITIRDLRGRTLASTLPLPPATSALPIPEDPEQEGDRLGTIQGLGAEGPFLTLRGPLREGGLLLGWVEVRCALDGLVALAQETAGLSRSGQVHLGAWDPAAGRWQAVDPAARAWASSWPPPDQMRTPQVGAMGRPCPVHHVDRADGTWLEVYLAATDHDWAVVVAVPEVEVLASLHGLRRHFLLVLLASVLVLGLLAARVGHGVTRPLVELAEAATRIRAGDHGQRVREAAREDELGALARAFNAMAADLTAANADLEARVAERTDALRRSNTELRQVAAAASHDLREPIHNIANMAALLERRCGEALDPQGRKTLGFLREGAARIRHMIDDLRALTRVMKGPPRALPTDLGGLVHEVLADLSGELEARDARVEVEDLPTLEVDPAAFRQVFDALLRNSLQFCGDDPPWVRISAEAGDPGSWTLVVEDHGEGIPEGLEDEVFDLFVQGRPRREGAGTGLGLAFCRKVVEAHGGSIRAAAGREEGARIELRLPG